MFFPGRSGVRSVWRVGPRHIGRRIAPLLAIAHKKGQAQQGGGANFNKPSEGQAQVAQTDGNYAGFESEPC